MTVRDLYIYNGKIGMNTTFLLYYNGMLEAGGIYDDSDVWNYRKREVESYTISRNSKIVEITLK